MRRDEIAALAARLGASHRLSPPEQFAGGLSGVFAGERDGQSVDFHDYRQYHPGDDLRRVDWRAYARTGQMQLRLFREETSPVVELHLDTSASMGTYPGKEQAALFFVAFLREAALSVEGRPFLCLDGGRFGGSDFDAAMRNLRFAGAEGLTARPIAGNAGRPLRFIISDFLFDCGAGAVFRGHVAGSHVFSPVMLLARSESDPAWRGFHRLCDVESPGAELDIRLDEKTLSAYRRRLLAHEEMLAAEARRLGGNLVRLDSPDGDLTAGDCEALVRRLIAERLVMPR